MRKKLAHFRREAKKLILVRTAFEIIWAAARPWMIAWGIILLINSFLPAGIVYLTKLVVDSVATAIGRGATWETISSILLPVGLMGGLMLLQQLFSSLNLWIRTAQTELITDYVKNLIHEKAAVVDFGFFEMPDFYNRLEQANAQAGGRTLSLLQNIGAVVQSAITFVTIAALLMTYSVWLPVVLLVGAIPAFLIVVRYNRIQHDWWVETTPSRRLATYFDNMLTRDFAAAEVRMNNVGGYFIASYRAIRKQLRDENLRLVRKQSVAGLIASGIGMGVTGGTMGWIVWRALRGLASLGDLALFYQAFNQGQSLIGTLYQNVGQIYTNVLFLEHLYLFLNQPSTLDSPDHPEPVPDTLTDGIRFENITFRYPGSHAPALEAFSLHIPSGKTVAIVGENGAGKSTFVKLLCRFYDPNEGRVTIDRTDIRRFDLTALRLRISVMFQFAMKYQFTAAENIQLGDREAPRNDARLQESAVAAGAHDFISRLPEGYDTLLGRYFEGGSELSGGQWQRIALARAFYRDAPIVVLDEPTSFMDSWAEMEWLRRFKELVRGRTALVITHRFTTAMQADLIYVMHDGRVVESGTHAELLQQGGLYASSWRTQMEEAEQRL